MSSFSWLQPIGFKFLSKYVCGNSNPNFYWNVFFFRFTFYFISILLACISVYQKHALFLWRWEEGVRSLETEVIDGCEPLCEWWNGIWSLREQQELLTSKPSLQPLRSQFFILIHSFIHSSTIWVFNHVLGTSEITGDIDKEWKGHSQCLHRAYIVVVGRQKISN